MTSATDPEPSLRLDPCGPGELAQVRAWLRRHITDPDRALDAELVATELITNAAEHGGGSAIVRITVTEPDRIRIEVADTNLAAMLTVGRSRLGHPRGNGLAIVDAVSSWGVERTTTGKTIWADLS
ncbi:ATP-binding protein [Pseudonocardia sp. HH130630-07]|uniref:ATP-binding protein n=1 Tax=Pseudonocardia sp. HH130630-07 TaxID=1690815 RepID=UPI0008152026|nr:ATP-binding protein [Pseudonocardia sp. HH130630-07]ANY08205.1 hypothetical protein AFB00_20150 [Pseudonocardia sp. HH130630-07]